MMKKYTCIILFFLGVSLTAQTKTETYEYINEKVDIYEYSDDFMEIDNELKEIKIDGVFHFTLNKVITTELSVGGFLYEVEPKFFTAINYEQKSKSIGLNIFFKKNKVKMYSIDSETEESELLDPVSKFTILLKSNISQKEKKRLRNAFMHLLELYNVNTKDMFD